MREEEQEQVLDAAMSALRSVVHGDGLCLASCILAQRILDRVMPGHGFALRLGSLHVVPSEGGEPLAFDPRGQDDPTDFHAWLETRDGELLEPSILPTLAMRGYDVAPDGYFTCHARNFVLGGLRLVYEDLPELEVRGLTESEPHLARMMAFAMSGIVPAVVGTIHLHVGWRRPVMPGS